MSPPLPSLISPPVTFAEGGASTVGPAHTLAAFRGALELGATGLASAVWLTADAVPVLYPTRHIKTGMRRVAIAGLSWEQLPGEIMSLSDLHQCTVPYQLSLDIVDPDTGSAVRAATSPLTLWVRSNRRDDLSRSRNQWSQTRLIYSVRLNDLRSGPERLAAQLAAEGIDGVCMPYSDWTGGLTTLFHRFDVLCLAQDAQHTRMYADLMTMGIDAVYGANVERMTAAFGSNDGI